MNGKQLDHLLEQRKELLDERAHLGQVLKLRDYEPFRAYLDGVKRRRDGIADQVFSANPLGTDAEKTAVLSAIKAKKMTYDYEISLIETADARVCSIKEALAEIDKQVKKLTAKPKPNGIVPPKY